MNKQDLLHVAIDFKTDFNALMVTRTKGDAFEIVNCIMGNEAVEVYNKLIGVTEDEC